MNDKQSRIIETDYHRDGKAQPTETKPGGWEARQLGCLCALVRHRYTNQYTGQTEYGHAIGFVEGGRYYFKSVVNENCPLHGMSEVAPQADAQEVDGEG